MKYVHIQRTAELASRQQLWCVRKDGNQRLVIDKALIDEFAEPEGRAFYVSTQEKLEVFCCSFEKNVLLRMCIQQQMRIFSMSH